MGSWIHGNQLVEYARHIRGWTEDNPGANACLLLIAPVSQLGSLLSQARDEVDGVNLGGVAWEHIADLAAETAGKVPSHRTRVYLEDFAELILYRLGEVGRPFTQEELTVLTDRQLASSLNRVYSLIRHVVGGLEARLDGDLGAKKSNGAGFTGYEFTYRGSSFWLGVWMHFWAAIGDSPLCLQVRQRIPNDVHWPEAIHSPVTGEWRGSVVPLRLIDGIERDELASVVASQAEQILKLLNPE